MVHGFFLGLKTKTTLLTSTYIYYCRKRPPICRNPCGENTELEIYAKMLLASVLFPNVALRLLHAAVCGKILDPRPASSQTFHPLSHVSLHTVNSYSV